MDTNNPEMGWTMVMRTSDLIKNYAAMMGNTSVDRITLTQQGIMSVVCSRPKPGVRVKDIAEELYLTPGAVSQTVETLVREGILVRVPDEHDRRAVLISLSEKGERMRELVTTHVGGIMREVLSEVSADEAEGFRKVLALMMQKVSKKYATLKSSHSTRTSSRMKTSVRMKNSVLEEVE